MPGDVTFMQPWHQDWGYGRTSLNAVTVWVPLHDVARVNGAIDVVPRSHRLGLLRTNELRNPRRLEIADDRFREDGVRTIELRFGECAFFSQFLVHRSGYNAGGKVRLTFQSRYADYGERTFANGGDRDAISAKSSTLLSPGGDDLRAFFG
jgi:ectoine hydroxylase-related dioxygenase (phytanoyl-CoA dioxygenase family)